MQPYLRDAVDADVVDLVRLLGACRTDGVAEDPRVVGPIRVYKRARPADAKEGVTSFLEKRPAKYPDRVSTDMPQPYPWRPTPKFRA